MASVFVFFYPLTLSGPQASEEVSKSLQAMKELLCGAQDKEPPTEAVAQLAQELYSSGLLVTLIADLQLIDFEVKSCARLSFLLLESKQ